MPAFLNCGENRPLVQLPDRISRLKELAADLWWSWTPEARALFRRLDYPLWRETAHNPVRMLQLVPQAALDRVVADRAWVAPYDRGIAGLDSARAAHNTWTATEAPELAGKSIAYFSAEFALHQSL